MSQPKTARSRYQVSVYEDPSAPGALRFTFAPKGPRQTGTPVDPPRAVNEYVASAQGHGDEPAFSWIKPPQEESTKAELEQIARERVTERVAWIRRVADLVRTVEAWAKEFGWSTKRIDKKIEDSRLGNHKAAGLVMQEDAVRILLEPISATAPGSDGLVDLYLMPGYDDIASLYHRDGDWHIHYVFPAPKAVAGIKEGESRPLSKKNLGVVLDAMKKHAE
jgi:hypothetical protein